jgi:hypothetical protein
MRALWQALFSGDAVVKVPFFQAFEQHVLYGRATVAAAPPKPDVG